MLVIQKKRREKKKERSLFFISTGTFALLFRTFFTTILKQKTNDERERKKSFVWFCTSLFSSARRFCSSWASARSSSVNWSLSNLQRKISFQSNEYKLTLTVQVYLMQQELPFDRHQFRIMAFLKHRNWIQTKKPLLHLPNKTSARSVGKTANFFNSSASVTLFALDKHTNMVFFSN